MMFRKFWAMFLIVILLVAITGCGSKVSRVNVVGSTSVQPIAELLAEEYMTEDSNTNINVQGGGSSAGIKAVLDGTAEIGASSRALTAEELKYNLKTYEIGLDGIAVISHPANKVTGLTIEQVKQIFSSEITNWSKVGGANLPIVVVNREAGSGTRGAFSELVMGEMEVTAKAIVQGSTGAVRQSVVGNPGAIGYISLAAADDLIKMLKINDVPCTTQNIKAKKYQIARPFLFITKNKPSEAATKFISYVLGEGQKLVVENGLVSSK